MFHNIPEEVTKRMQELEEQDAADREDGTSQLKRLRQIPPETGKFIALELKLTDAPPSPETEEEIRKAFGKDAACIVSSPLFVYVPGPITPDHLVYSRAFPYYGSLTETGAETYRNERGYAPKVVVAGDRIYGIGTSQKNADLALELAQDGALVMQLTAAFGGINYMTDAQREFIENWEVESYRAQQAE